MESASIALACHQNQVPFGILRSISDGEGEAMEYEKFKDFSSERSCRVIFRALKMF